MANENNRSNVRISNWTLATRTEPGRRYVYALIEPKERRGSRTES